jgi:magnesium-transporting ATPase (P-type)
VEAELIDHVLINLLQAIRGGRTVKISIFEIVVGDVLPLKIGDQVNLSKS